MRPFQALSDEFTGEELSRKLPHISAAARDSLHSELQAGPGPTDEIDRESLREVQEVTQSPAEIAGAVCILDAQGATVDHITVDGSSALSTRTNIDMPLLIKPTK